MSRQSRQAFAAAQLFEITPLYDVKEQIQAGAESVIVDVNPKQCVVVVIPNSASVSAAKRIEEQTHKATGRPVLVFTENVRMFAARELSKDEKKEIARRADSLLGAGPEQKLAALLRHREVVENALTAAAAAEVVEEGEPTPAKDALAAWNKAVR